MAGDYDIVIRAGRVIDPETGRDEVTDVGLRDDTIVRVGAIADPGSAQVIDATGKVVCPGFIDLHAHGQTVAADWMQAHDGVTTSLELEVGVLPVAPWYEAQAAGGRVLNYGASAAWLFARKEVVSHIGADPQRHPVEMMGAGSKDMRWAEEVAEEEEMARIVEMTREALADGAIGIGIPNGYAPGTGVKELTSICELAAETGTPTYTHIPFMANIDPRSALESYVRLIGLAGATGAHMHVCHLNSTSLLDIERCREVLLKAQAMGLPITTEAYPYGTGSTVVSAAFFTDPDFVRRTGSTYDQVELVHNRHRFEGLEDILATREKEPGALVMWHFLDTEGDENHQRLLDLSVLYPGGIIASDAVPWIEPDGSLYRGEEWPLPDRLSSHPRSSGTFTRFLRQYHRERGAVSMLEAIERCTILPARVIETCLEPMRRKARLQEDCDADVIVFDPLTVSDRADFSRMNAAAIGMDHVIVGGTAVIADGRLDPHVRPGRALRRPV